MNVFTFSTQTIKDICCSMLNCTLRFGKISILYNWRGIVSLCYQYYGLRSYILFSRVNFLQSWIHGYVISQDKQDQNNTILVIKSIIHAWYVKVCIITINHIIQSLETIM